MTPARTVLYLQHADRVGGSCTSLRVMLEHLDRSRFRPVVALRHGDARLVRYHEDAGAEVLVWPGISTFEHTTAFSSALLRPLTWSALAATAAGWRETERRTLELVSLVRPDVVHLNSAVLVPSARALRRASVRFVWHVREIPARGRLGVRTRLHREALIRWPSARVFLSPCQRRQWIGDAAGTVIPELVDRRRFTVRDPRDARRRLGIGEDEKVILFLGGMAPIKGIHPLLEALALVRRTLPRLTCLMPGAEPLAPGTSIAARIGQKVLSAFRVPTPTERIEGAIPRLGLQEVCRRSGYADDVVPFIAASDVVVFPSTTDHFARPIVEAAAMERPVIASRFPLIEEVVRDGDSALLVTPSDAPGLAAAILRVLSDAALAGSLASAGRRLVADRFDARTHTEAMMHLYDQVIGAAPPREREQSGGAR
jgi:glycosyltransferase involved in cell wall biosynthesis